MKKTMLVSGFLLGVGAAVIWAYSKKGLGQKVGEKLDDTGEKIRDALTPEGPLQKVGKRADKVVKDFENAIT